MAIIEVDHIHKRYRDAVAVEDVSFAVERGEIFAILGPNGAGKTAAVEIVEGLRVPDRAPCGCSGWTPGGTGPSCGGASASSSSRASCPSR